MLITRRMLVELRMESRKDQLEANDQKTRK
jgi:hypothetical protein